MARQKQVPPTTLREARERIGSLVAVSRLAEIDPSHLSRVERGESSLSAEMIGRLAPALKVDGSLLAQLVYQAQRAKAERQHIEPAEVEREAVAS